MASQIQVTFVGDTKDLDGAFRKVRGEADRFGSAVDNTSKKTTGALGKMGGAVKGFGAGVVAGFGVDKVIEFGTEMLSTFEDVQANAKRLNVTFGDQAGRITELSDRLNQFAGVSTLAMEGFATQVGSLLVPLGFTRDQVAGLTTNAVELANGLALASNVPFEQSINAVSSALVGERESLKSLGVVIDESMIKDELARQGKANLEGAARRQAEAEATLSLITQQSSDDQEIANSIMAEGGTASKNLEAAFADLKVLLAEELGPRLQDAARFIGDVVRGLADGDGALEDINPAAEDFADALRNIASAAQQAWDIGKKVWDIFSKIDSLGGTGKNPGPTIFGIPLFANGGQVDGPTWVGERGPELLLPGPGGPTVIPHGKAGYGDGGGSTVVINVAGSVIAERDLARTLEGVMGGRGYNAGGA